MIITPKGGGDTYETMLEIPLTAEMLEEEDEVLRTWYTNMEAAALPKTQGLFFNSAEYPLTWNESQGRYEYNLNLEKEGYKDDPSKPLLVVNIYKDEHDDKFICIGSTEDDPDLTGTTVRILKKASGGGSMVVTLTPTETEGEYMADTDSADIIAAFNAKTPVYIYDSDDNGMLQVFAVDVNKTIMAQIMSPADVTDGLKSIGVAYYLGTANSRKWCKTQKEYAVNEGKPLVLEVTPLSQTEYRIDNVSAAQINTAWSNNRNVELKINGQKLELVNSNYTSDSNYVFKLQGSVVSRDTGVMSVFMVSFDNSLTGNLTVHNYTPNP